MMKNWTLHFVNHASCFMRTKYRCHLGSLKLLLLLSIPILENFVTVKYSNIGKKHYTMKRDERQSIEQRIGQSS